ncbi:hypothetical protein [Staphylococcus hominis]|uniref:hypothetical protein n=1 Tax=Staphylococcus hominis TaxID=1290 RepID=UPI0011A9CBDC|nr:hypothetical protein [Staphylococcus hominis]
MANWGELIITSLSSGTVVAVVNHYLQLSRRKKEIIFENKSTLIREKMKNFYDINRDLNEIVLTIFNIEKSMSDFKDYSLNENNEKLKEKFENTKKSIENSEEKTEDRLKNLDSNLVFFPKTKNSMHINGFDGKLSDVFDSFQKLKNLNKVPFVDSFTQEENEIFTDFVMSCSRFLNAGKKVLDKLTAEGNEIYKYLDDEK